MAKGPRRSPLHAIATIPGSSPRAPDPDFSISITKSGSDCTHSCAPDTSTPFFSGITVMKTNANERTPLHLIDSEADRTPDLALRVEHSQPPVDAMRADDRRVGKK